jgi:hypothetical protein
VRVAAKIPSVDDADLAMLEHEARMYNGFPKHLNQDWSGFNAIRSAETGECPGQAAVVPATAVVPKLYGYFVPSEKTVEKSSSAWPILLMEDRRQPVDPKSPTPEQRWIAHPSVRPA